ncbi:hypothetical protein KC330_g1179 [Hortaea werneckii]|nr:hypothetical protein KC330_g1179 [Hortaea werneckii]
MSPPGSDKSPLNNFEFLNNVEQKQTKDGQPPKRRGPKPDSKPALTRRQELNRQAQRTHRERKEMYIKALEQEVLRLKELFGNTTRERDTFAEENRRLKELLAAHGIRYDFSATPIKFERGSSAHESSGYGPSSSGSLSGSYAGGSESTNLSPPPPLPGQQLTPNGVPSQPRMHTMAQLPSNRFDYDSVGIDFVLTAADLRLERPCMDHMQYLLVRSHNNENQPMHHPMENADDSEHEHMSGHALMATAPPHSHVMQKPAEKYPHQMPLDLGPDGLSKLLDLSNRLPFDRYTEITPVMAWTTILRHERVRELTEADILTIKEDLSTKVRCYGFGAVLEEFELDDALTNVFAQKDPIPAISYGMARQQIAAA